MRLLLDTHVALWAILGDRRMSSSTVTLIEDADETYVSLASIWEIAIKYPLARAGRGEMPISVADALAAFSQADFLVLGITAEHAKAVEGLPPVHADPFDRMLVAQALHEPLRFLTRDRQLAAYSDAIVLV